MGNVIDIRFRLMRKAILTYIRNEINKDLEITKYAAAYQAAHQSVGEYSTLEINALLQLIKDRRVDKDEIPIQ